MSFYNPIRRIIFMTTELPARLERLSDRLRDLDRDIRTLLVRLGGRTGDDGPGGAS